MPRQGRCWTAPTSSTRRQLRRPCCSTSTWSSGRLRRVSLGGTAGAPSGTLEDQADVVEGLLALYAVTGERRWSDAAGRLVDALLQRFWHSDTGFSDTPLDDPDPLLAHAGDAPSCRSGGQRLPLRSRSSGGCVVVLVGAQRRRRAREVAEQALAVTARTAASSPRFAGWGLAVAEAALDGPREVAVVGGRDDELTRALWREALAGTAPGLVLAVGEPSGAPSTALLAERDLVHEGAAAYPCRGMVCDLPTSDPAALRAFVRPGASA